MAEALLFGVIASSGLVLGSLVGTKIKIPQRVLAFLLAFASGSLISALAFELFEDAYQKSGAWISGVAFVAGAAVFVTASAWIDRWAPTGTPDSQSPKGEKRAATTNRASPGFSPAAGFALLAAVTLDGVPENVALGISLGEESGGAALLLAIFASNFPEAVVGSAAMESAGRSARFAVGVWALTAVVLLAAVVAGRVLFSPDPQTVSIPLAFAGGAVIASLADTLMPQAFEGGGPLVAFATVAGFFLSYLLSL
ncbi:MAG: zinc permease [Actinomycetota bacterium]|nr:zinc permease [Actinomycetota bacterium]